MRKIDGVIFDMDGLLLDTEPPNREAMIAACLEFGFVLEDDVFNRLIGTSSVMCERVLSETFPDFPAREVLARDEILRIELREKYGITAKRGAGAVLDYLDAKKIKKALATSTDENIAEKCLESVGFGNRFDVKIFGSMVSRSKPDPEIFLTAAEKLGVIPSRCVVLEDSFNGVRAAFNAGMLPIMVPDLILPDDEIKGLYFACVKSLDDAVGILEELI